MHWMIEAGDSRWSVIEREERPSEAEARRVLGVGAKTRVTVKAMIQLKETTAAEFKAGLARQAAEQKAREK